jgi:hypothetical protein
LDEFDERGSQTHTPGMKRVILSLAIGYVVLGLVTRAQEAAGHRTCTCSPDCWCKTPGLSLFRWVFPRFHHEMNPEAGEKQ